MVTAMKPVKRTRSVRPVLRLTCGALLFATCGAAVPAILYKSVSSSGVIQFSDMPPEKGRPAQQLQIPDGSSSPPAPVIAQGTTNGPTSEEKLREMDATVQRANAQVDVAERAFAVARRPVWTEPEPGKLPAPRMTRADVERIEFYKRSVIVARQTLLEVLQQKRLSAVREEMTASAGAPIYGALTPRH